MNTGFKSMLKDVNSHQFLTKFSPLSLQQSFPLQQDIVLIQKISLQGDLFVFPANNPQSLQHIDL